jgi:hypothetical protein
VGRVWAPPPAGHHEGCQTLADRSSKERLTRRPTPGKTESARPRRYPDPRPQPWARPEQAADNAVMEITNSTADAMTIQVTRGEAITLNNALNEVCNGINWSDSEFSIRMGLPREEAKELLRTINDALRPQRGDNP